MSAHLDMIQTNSFRKPPEAESQRDACDTFFAARASRSAVQSVGQSSKGGVTGPLAWLLLSSVSAQAGPHPEGHPARVDVGGVVQPELLVLCTPGKVHNSAMLDDQR